MTNPKLFSSGIELASFVTSSRILCKSWNTISSQTRLKATRVGFSTRVENTTEPDSLATGISLQLQALGLTPHIQVWQQENIDIDALERNLTELEEKFILQKKISFDPSKKLNDIKIHMAYLEWYKKETKNQQIGYYDSYKNMNTPCDHDGVEFHRKLTSYWEKMVEEVEMKPQKEGATFRTRWLYGGTTYRRMVEPLEIAEYYREGGKDYANNKRSKHFKQLSEWLMEDSKNATSDIDSCFWAHVEEALLLCMLVQGDEFEEEEGRNKCLKADSK
ncbi:unnamed protein product [Vicia faba]|uniref:EDS1 EP domain-containing protein n=1 Tax=Vicia faba TaxID=3906 RepID=A0AAV0ZGV9_VICFA|nr:unnamed protein product [Vicia faba]